MTKEQAKADEFIRLCHLYGFKETTPVLHRAFFDAGVAFAESQNWHVIETDGLPEKGGEELIITYLVDGTKQVSAAHFHPDEGEFYWGEGIGVPFFIQNVIAWRPLPDPWEAK